MNHKHSICELIDDLGWDHVTEGGYNSKVEFRLFRLEFGFESGPSLGVV